MWRLVAVPVVLAGLCGLLALELPEGRAGPAALLRGLGFVALCEILLLLLTAERRPQASAPPLRLAARGSDDGPLMADKEMAQESDKLVTRVANG
ncbi:hypothetical protein SAMN05216189_104810 [Pseudomonas delhiensis]|uniref:Uncharacterized protein n=1 Tax=Pseudomonas delhiensis TaxID=366289 RepID=A0A239LPJ6_9PSED|nr:hypothetical protein [Pseudomonas delhiensis]SDK70848.1 hypothetical protein SAMN05216189_104810 [Pseudomonas delhiensis]SNT31733.1 hypothetical protein SAMN06295949_12131 [Pseudomonas delhiensis]